MTSTELPRLERATREHALQFARAQFERGERVDMQTLAAELGVGRTTLYRWFGDREQVISELFAGLTDEIFAEINARPGGGGIEAALDSIRRFMALTSSFEPLRDFAQREPALALRILVASHGLVQQRIRAGVTEALERNLPSRQLPLPPDIIDVLVQVGANLQWTPIVIGDPPEIERALHLGRSVLENHLP
ncbi:QsdR family transcriptional regulator [Nocardioides marmorisolisilvae]|uniref:TetR/AcrR family transcriptional regulator n=1 Tax=Nocardioides marmorisolisilvae TaxID=1542737 RepID=A0A3N0DWF8_9ACTN|nr:QsdR family transcriptional regulator [Nocardioides marmorisolisilvae]RNL79891.1 TetR/AcrR family transcriptional regulator [Nocardioides marmorisolisilvae]